VVVSLGVLALALWSTLRTVIRFSQRRAAPALGRADVAVHVTQAVPGLSSDYGHGAKRKRSPGRPGR
jgi:hypothetical protein